MSGPDDGTWYELRPNGHLAVAVRHPQRYRDQAEAEEAGRRMRERLPDFRFVEIVRYEESRGERSRAVPVARV
jgi:hypothetical protein